MMDRSDEIFQDLWNEDSELSKSIRAIAEYEVEYLVMLGRVRADARKRKQRDTLLLVGMIFGALVVSVAVGLVL